MSFDFYRRHAFALTLAACVALPFVLWFLSGMFFGLTSNRDVRASHPAPLVVLGSLLVGIPMGAIADWAVWPMEENRHLRIGILKLLMWLVLAAVWFMLAALFVSLLGFRYSSFF